MNTIDTLLPESSTQHLDPIILEALRECGDLAARFAQNDSEDLGALEELLREPTRRIMSLFIGRGLVQRALLTPDLCPDCDVKLTGARKARRTFLTIAGNVSTDRRIGSCPKCLQSVCPLDRTLAMQKGYSPWVQETVATLASKMPYAEAQEVFTRLTGLGLSAASFHRLALDVGERAQQTLEQMNQFPIQEDPCARQKDPFVMIIEIDAWNIRERDNWGKAAQLRKKGKEPGHWHWVWTGTVFCLEDRLLKGKRPIILNRGYVVTALGLDALREQLHAEALRRGLGRATKVVILADGASWIWNLASDRFPKAVQRLDLYHLRQHLWVVARELYPNEERAAARWFARKKKQLSKGRATAVIADIQKALKEIVPQRQEQVGKELNYFKEHRHRMDYDQAIDNNEPLGSGAIESTCRQYQSRFKTAGQFWSRTGDEALLSLATFWRNRRMPRLFPHIKLSPHYEN